jgi:NADP-dependent 3-hydroxy acid dehydrogenase YdfG
LPDQPDTRSAVIVGGSRGIGFATAGRLSSAGFRLLLVARDEAVLANAAAQVNAAFVALDLADAASGHELERAVRRQLAVDTPDVMVNAAGVFELAALAETTAGMFERSLAANLWAPFIAIRTFLPGMLKRGSGHIVTVGSIAGRIAFPHNGAYSAAKYGVRGLHAVLDQEIRGTGVRATLIEPAATDTNVWDGIDKVAHGPLPAREAMLKPADVADAIYYAISCPPHVDVRSIALERS